MIDRRGFLKGLGMLAGAMVLDGELWVPGQKSIFIPPVPAVVEAQTGIAVATAEELAEMQTWWMSSGKGRAVVGHDFLKFLSQEEFEMALAGVRRTLEEERYGSRPNGTLYNSRGRRSDLRRAPPPADRPGLGRGDSGVPEGGPGDYGKG